MYWLGVLESSFQSSLGSLVLFLGSATLEQNSLQWLPSTPKAPLGLNFFITLLFSLFGGGACAAVHIGDHRTTCSVWFCPSTTWAPETELKSVGVAASTCYPLSRLTSPLGTETLICLSVVFACVCLMCVPVHMSGAVRDPSNSLFSATLWDVGSNSDPQACTERPLPLSIGLERT